MTEPDPRTEVAVVVAFLERFLVDRAQNTTRTLAEYQAGFPGYEAAIAREYAAAMEGSSEADGVDRAALSALPDEGQTSGRYDRHEEIARGGMGRIHRVWDRDLERFLAMKVMAEPGGASDSGPSSSQALQRFLLEARITGQLEHPGIVPVHDIGIGEDGCVYFTMSMVQGRNLQQIIRLVRDGKEGWTTPRALNVLLRVCEAVAFAHSKDVIHRDLKPSNVMVGQFGETYVMDWGLARQLGQDEEAADGQACNLEPTSPLMTLDGDVIGTPAYMSPEQARGDLDRVGTRADVYAIGAMLYHLLAGSAPYATSEGTSDAETVLPLVRQGPPAALAAIEPGIPEELVAICDKAMAREPEARYPEVMNLADDLRAFLETRVVRAHETGAWAELRKWVRRNKRFAITAALGVTALVVGLAFALVERERADRTAVQLESDRQWSLEFAFDVLEELGTDMAENELRNLPGGRQVRLRVLESTKKFYEDFLAERGSDSRVREHAARAYGRLAAIHRHLGSYDDSRTAAEQSVRMYRALIANCPANDPKAVPHRLSLARQRVMLASILGSQGQLPESAEEMAQVATDVRSIIADDAANAEARHTLAQILRNLSIIHDRMQRMDAREAAIDESLRVRERLVADHPNDSRFKARLAAVYVVKIHYLTRVGSPEAAAAAEEFSGKAEALYLELLEKDKGEVTYRVGLGDLYTQRGILRTRQPGPDRYKHGYEDHQKALRLREGLAEEFPNVHSYIAAVGASMTNVGSQFLWTNQPERARPLFEKAIAKTRQALALVPKHMVYQKSLRTQLAKLSSTLTRLNLHREAAGLADDLLEANPDAKLGHLAVARTLADCVAACDRDPELSAEQRAERRETYASRCVAQLQKAHELGLVASNLAERRFDPLRARADFRRFAAAVKGR